MYGEDRIGSTVDGEGKARRRTVDISRIAFDVSSQNVSNGAGGLVLLRIMMMSG